MNFREALFNKEFFRTEERKKRLFSSVFYGILISIPHLILTNFLSIDEKRFSLRVDVLHVIAIGLLIVMFVYLIAKNVRWLYVTVGILLLIFGIWRPSLYLFAGIPIILVIYLLSKKARWLMALLYFTLLIITVCAYPLLHNVDLAELPISIAPYVNDFGTLSQFSLVPWLAYIFAGGLMGIWLSHEIKGDNFEKSIGFKLAGLGLGFLLISKLGDAYEIYLYGRSYYWHDSVNLIYHRFGVVLCVGSVMAFLSLIVTDLPKFMKQMSRNTLWLYVGHLIIIYQIVKPIIGGGTRFSLPITILLIITMFLLMYVQTQIIIYVQSKGGYVAMFKSWTAKKPMPDEIQNQPKG